jgi:hypothetical protein
MDHLKLSHGAIDVDSGCVPFSIVLQEYFSYLYCWIVCLVSVCISLTKDGRTVTINTLMMVVCDISTYQLFY